MRTATITTLRLGTSTNHLYAQSKSGNVYRYNLAVCNSRTLPESFVDRIQAAGGRINTAHWTKVK